MEQCLAVSLHSNASQLCDSKLLRRVWFSLPYLDEYAMWTVELSGLYSEDNIKERNVFLGRALIYRFLGPLISVMYKCQSNAVCEISKHETHR